MSFHLLLYHIDLLMQKKLNSSLFAMELHLFCIRPSKFAIIVKYIHAISKHWKQNKG